MSLFKRTLAIILLLISIGLLAFGQTKVRREASIKYRRTYLRSKIEANEASAISNLRTFVSAQATYQSTTGNGRYATLTQLSEFQLIDPLLACGEKNGYRFSVRLTPLAQGYEVTATPLRYGSTGRRSFYVDEEAVVRGADKKGRLAGRNDPALEAKGCDRD